MTRWCLSAMLLLLIASGAIRPTHAVEPAKPASEASAADLLGDAAPAKPEPPVTPLPQVVMPNILGGYTIEPRDGDGRVLIDPLVARLKLLGVNTYLWRIWDAPTDWADLKLFLPRAAQAGINVWVIVGPATQNSPDGKFAAEPFKGDYVRWAKEIATLSLTNPNLKAWALDKFISRYTTVLKPEAVREIQFRGKSINPKLAFMVAVGFGDLAGWDGAINRPFLNAFHDVLDGVIGLNPRHRDDIDEYWSVLNDGPHALADEFRFPWEEQSQAGDFAMASRTFKVLPGDTHKLRFRERDTFTGQTAGYHIKQLLADDVVVWEQDVAGGTMDWADVTVDLKDAVKGKQSVTLTLRMIDKKPVGKFTVRWRITGMQAEGLDPGKDLGEPAKWKASKQGSFETGFGGVPEPGKRRFHLPLIVVCGADALDAPLQAYRDGRCEGVVINTQPKDPKNAFSEEVKKAFAPGGK